MPVPTRLIVGLAVAVALVAAACGGSSESSQPPAPTPDATAVPEEVAPESTSASNDDDDAQPTAIAQQEVEEPTQSQPEATPAQTADEALLYIPSLEQIGAAVAGPWTMASADGDEILLPCRAAGEQASVALLDSAARNFSANGFGITIVVGAVTGADAVRSSLATECELFGPQDLQILQRSPGVLGPESVRIDIEAPGGIVSLITAVRGDLVLSAAVGQDPTLIGAEQESVLAALLDLFTVESFVAAWEPLVSEVSPEIPVEQLGPFLRSALTSLPDESQSFVALHVDLNESASSPTALPWEGTLGLASSCALSSVVPVPPEYDPTLIANNAIISLALLDASLCPGTIATLDELAAVFGPEVGALLQSAQ